MEIQINQENAYLSETALANIVGFPQETIQSLAKGHNITPIKLDEEFYYRLSDVMQLIHSANGSWSLMAETTKNMTTYELAMNSMNRISTKSALKPVSAITVAPKITESAPANNKASRITKKDAPNEEIPANLFPCYKSELSDKDAKKYVNKYPWLFSDYVQEWIKDNPNSSCEVNAIFSQKDIDTLVVIRDTEGPYNIEFISGYLEKHGMTLKSTSSQLRYAKANDIKKRLRSTNRNQKKIGFSLSEMNEYFKLRCKNIPAYKPVPTYAKRPEETFEQLTLQTVSEEETTNSFSKNEGQGDEFDAGLKNNLSSFQ